MPHIGEFSLLVISQIKLRFIIGQGLNLRINFYPLYMMKKIIFILDLE